MPTRTLSDEARRTLALFEETTGVAGTDCVVDDEFDRAVVLVDPSDMADAIGPGGRTVREVEDALGRTVKLVEDADTAEDFVANALAPAAVYDVTIETEGDADAAADGDAAGGDAAGGDAAGGDGTPSRDATTDGGDTVAYADVDDADVGAAIGEDGRNVEAARIMAQRHFGVDDVQLV